MSTPLDEIKAKIAATEAKLIEAEREINAPMISIWATLLIKQQETKNLLLADQSKCICMI